MTVPAADAMHREGVPSVDESLRQLSAAGPCRTSVREQALADTRATRPHDIDATVPGFGRMQLKSGVVKKVLQ
ncbi:PhnA domain-containing protein [Salinibacterium hongtaonis]|uniref:PhnA domain-containing protein n=1 Tax=Homoserinimonas hongtaonis TaxID=2079791 RepID=UPI001F544A1D|nr:PhnA domain-containing protein [Salinibacterium hongtaonis]